MTDFTGVGHASPYPGSSRAVAALQDGAGNSSSAEPESSAVGAGSSSIYAETEVHSAQHYEPLGSTGTATLARPMQDVQMGQDINLLRGPRHHPAPDEPFDLHIKSTPICAGTIDANKTPLPGPSSKDTEMHVADEPLHHVGSKDPVISTAGSGSSKGKQKQKAVHFEPSMPAQVSIARTEVPDGQPIAEDLKPGDARWATSSEKPPAKLPIRLLDALGRTFVFPWEKVKTWQGMKRLIDACFLHVDLPLVRPHVLAGHFDLLGETRISHDGTFLTLGLPSVVSSSYHSTSSKEIQTTSTHSSPNDENDGQSSSSSPSSASSVQSEAQRVLLESTQPLAESAIILPELWEDFVVPGMLVRMVMWPLSTPRSDVQPEVGRGRGVVHPAVSVVIPVGRGRGMNPTAMNNFFGVPVPPRPAPPSRVARPKTRKKPE